MSMNAQAFLKALWADLPSADGPFIQIWTLADRRTAYYASAAGPSFDGERDVFTGVGLAGKRHGAGHRAKAGEVVAISGLWLDIDVGPKGCPTRNDAFALATACLPPTMIVSSGHGLHAYHLLPKPWRFRTRDEQACAGIIAQQWCARHQQIAAEHGWRIDSVGDLARVLRLPGSLNAKDGGDARPVMVLGLDPASGPRYEYRELAEHVRDMPIAPQPVAATAAAHVDLRADATDFEAKLDALLENSPEFRAVWEHQRRMPDDSPSSYDMSLCNLAAGAMNDGELRALIQAHRAKWADWCAEHDASERRPDGYSQAKGRRESYLVKTIASARRAEQRARLDNLGRRQAA